MTHDTRSRYLSALVAVAIAGGIATVLSWGPVPPGGPLPPSAAAHYDDMAPRPQPPTSGSTIGPQAPTSSEAPRLGAPARDREPALVTIPDLGIEADVIRTGMDASGSILVPEDVLVTGWFDASRRLAAPYGSTVIVGHRDSATQGTGALYAIEELPPGTSLTVTDRSGVEHAFVIESVELIDKAVLPAEAPRIFTHRGPYRLVLITCGGAFDETARSYLSNVVITALPASASSE
ncbi:MAG: hypothetical protein RL134_669 [Actinomycetota bacterium]